jgi:heptosyltransferase-1
MVSVKGEPSSSEAKGPGRVLIILLGSIGDVVRALPLAGRMRRAWPDVYVAWAIEPKSAPLLQDHPWVDELIIYDRKHAPWSFPPFLAKVRARDFDLVIDLQRHLKSGVTSRISGAAIRLGFARENVKEWNHWFSNRRIPAQPPRRLKLLQYQAFGDVLGLPPAPIQFGFRLDGEKIETAKRLLGELPARGLAVILGSSWPSRVYSPEAVAAVIRSLREPLDDTPSFYPILFGGADDQLLAREVSNSLGGMSAHDLTGKSPLGLLPALFSLCAVAFGPDCGPMHIAAAVNCPVVSLWGATAAERSAPWGYAEFALTGTIPCSPCYLRECPIGRECMHRIDPVEVAKAVRRAYMHRLSSEFSQSEGQGSGLGTAT